MTDHSHHHHQAPSNVTKAFMVGILLNSVYVIAEFTVGYFQSSLALMTDAGHNATDVMSLLLSLLGFRMMKMKATPYYTYGYKKVSILVSLLNAVLLIFAVGVIFYEGVRRFYEPVQLEGLSISLVALIGVVVNGASALLFFRSKDHDINVKGAYLHLLADALVSIAVVLGGIAIYYTGLTWIDAALSFLVGIVILRSTWSLLNDSIRLALDGTPANIAVEEIRDFLKQQPGIKDVNHIHIWSISSTQNAMTAHIILDEEQYARFPEIKKRIKHELEHRNIHHVTLEPELQGCHDEC